MKEEDVWLSEEACEVAQVESWWDEEERRIEHVFEADVAFGEEGGTDLETCDDEEHAKWLNHFKDEMEEQQRDAQMDHHWFQWMEEKRSEAERVQQWLDEEARQAEMERVQQWLEEEARQAEMERVQQWLEEEERQAEMERVQQWLDEEARQAERILDDLFPCLKESDEEDEDDDLEASNSDEADSDGDLNGSNSDGADSDEADSDGDLNGSNSDGTDSDKDEEADDVEGRNSDGADESGCKQKRKYVEIVGGLGMFVDTIVTDEVDICPVDLTGDNVSVHSRKKEDYVWGGEADSEDVLQIEKMLMEGYGVYGSPNCKLEVGPSLLSNAGMGVFIKEHCTIKHGDCITKYSGQFLRTAMHRSVDEQLRTIQLGDIVVLGATTLRKGDGFGSMMNSSVCNRIHSFCRFVKYSGSIYIMAHVVKRQYPLRGRMELYLTAGHSWWALYNSTHGQCN